MNTNYNYEILTDMNVLYESFQKCKQDVYWKSSIQRYEANLLSNLNSIRKQLINNTYSIDTYAEFTVNERGKIRHIKAPTIKDRIVQRALNDYILEPAIKPYLIYHNGASIKGKGVEFTRESLVCDLQEFYRNSGDNNGYVVKGDISNYFGSIEHNKLIDSLQNIILDIRTIKLLEKIVNSNGKRVGLGLGSPTNQLLGVYYLTPLDNFCTNVKGCKMYGRHMDDFYIIHKDKQFLKELLLEIEEESKKLGLKLNERKTQIIKLSKGFTFLKQRVILTDTGKIIQIPCKENIARERRKLKKLHKKYVNNEISLKDIEDSYRSWKGGIEKYNSHNAVKNMDKLYRELFN